MKYADRELMAKVLTRDEKRGAPNDVKRGYAYLNNEGIPMIGIGRNLKTTGLSLKEMFSVLFSLNLNSDRDNLDDNIDMENLMYNGIRFDNLRSWQDFTNNKPLSDNIISELLIQDIDRAYYNAKKKMGNVRNLTFLPVYAQEVLIQIIFILDAYSFDKFEKVIEAFKVNNLKIAADEILKAITHEAVYSKTFRRLDENRFHRYANVLRTGDKREYQLD